MTGANLFDIGELQEFVKDGQFEAFTRKLKELTVSGVALIKQDGDVLCGFMGKEAAKDYLYSRMRQKIIERPDLLNRIKDCLDDDDLVD